jgi:multidrug efflux pump subunit AcrA (membrane-fusion protein)
MDTPVNPIAVLLHLEQRAQQMRTQPELGFVIVNETWQLLPYRQAALFVAEHGDRARLTQISNLATLSDDSPFTVWLKRLGAHCWKTLREPDGPAAPLQTLRPETLPPTLADEWATWMSPHVLLLALVDPSGQRRGFLLINADEGASEQQQALLARLGATYAYCIGALARRRPALFQRMRTTLRTPWRRLVLLAIVAGVMAIPVRLSVLAPAEIVALHATAVSAPLDGVVKSFQVDPNQGVKRGQPLFTLDDTTLRNRRDVAQQALAVARADALRATQKAFDNAQSKSELASLNGQVREKEAELAWLDEMLGRVQVRAPRDGIMVFGDPNDWVGKPVATGERIALLADQDDAGVLVWLPAADAINLEAGAEIRLFLHVAPLSPLHAELTETSYQAVVSPDNIAAYRVKGRITADDDHVARIGLKGTAKIYGRPVPLAYYLLRRPLAALREWSGL